MGKDPELCPNGMDVAKLTHKKVLQTLENGVRFGKWVLLENIGEVGNSCPPQTLLRFLHNSNDAPANAGINAVLVRTIFCSVAQAQHRPCWNGFYVGVCFVFFLYVLKFYVDLCEKRLFCPSSWYVAFGETRLLPRESYSN